MEAFLIYLLKASGILAIFYMAYQAFLKRETFFAVNRHFLIAGILSALLLPFVTITNYVEINTTPLDLVANQPVLAKVNGPVQEFNWIALLFGIYCTGFLIFTTKFIAQFLSLKKLISSNKVAKKGKFYHVETTSDIAPFSFFHHIFYNPKHYSSSEISAIIKHEKAHSLQWHSIDVLLSHLITIFTWMNPFSWLYQKNMKQNLEFLADESATREVPSIKNYQYTLLKVSGNHFCTPIVNNFYNSLIKKRIVMLNKSKSSKRNILKVALILPALAVFLVSFNTKEVYIPLEPLNDGHFNTTLSSKIIEIKIDKNTTDKELSDIKRDLAKKGVDFSYTVVHNSNNEITDLSIDFSYSKSNKQKMQSSASYTNEGNSIDPVLIVYNDETNSISIGNTGTMQIHKNKKVHFGGHKDSDKTIWVHAGGDSKEHKTIEIIEENDREIIKINGKEVSREEFNAMKEKEGVHEKHIEIKKTKSGSGSNVFIMKDSDSDSDTDIKVISEDGSGFFFVNTDGDEKPMFIIDGKESKEKAMKKLKPSQIETINVYKGKKAAEKYGAKGKNGVVEITTKKE